MTEYAIGIDLGGTNIKAGIVSESGELKKTWKIATEAEKGGNHVVDLMLSLCETIQKELPDGIKREQIIGVGVGSPGVFDYSTGALVAGAVNIPGLDGTPMRSRFEKTLGLPARVDNDANVFALAEARWGAGSGAQHILGYTLGTGVGGGVVINGKVFHGGWGFAGELGHVTVDPAGPPCNCGNTGCLEVYASANAIANHAREIVGDDPDSCLSAIPREEITCKDVGEAAIRGDALALSVVKRAAYYLGIGIGAAVIVVNPEVVVIGGGGAQIGELLFNPIREALLSRVYHQRVRGVPILAAKLGTDSGMIGAGALIFADR